MEEKGKLSYEDLENVCRQLSQQASSLKNQCASLKAMLQDANLTNLYKKLDYLFRIVEGSASCFPDEFKQKCVEDIMYLMTPAKNEQNEGD